MPKVKDIIEGLQIAARYCVKGTEADITNAEHDELLAMPDHEMSAEDFRRMEELGWLWNDDGYWKCFT